jgi:hypothetical protein
MQSKIVLYTSFILAALVIYVSSVGLFTSGFYAAETVNWQAQSVGQDMVDLFLISPCLLLSAVFVYRNNRSAFMIWGGTVLYLTYTFALYCFDVHFNKLFVLYCLCFGLAFYSTLYFLFTQYRWSLDRHFERNAVTRMMAIYLVGIAVLFYFLWLSEIIPSTMQNTIPMSVVETGLFTNGVHVLDLAIILPAIGMTGVLIWKGLSLGFILAPMFLSFFVLMDITIGTLAYVMYRKGIEDNFDLTMIMGVLTILSLGLLVWYFKKWKQ